MKYKLIIILIMMQYSLFSQSSISSSYNNNGMGNNIDFHFNHIIKDHNQLSLGFTYLINSDWKNKITTEIYHKNFYAFTFIQHFGIQFEYKYLYFKKLNTINLYNIFTIHYTYGQTRSNNLILESNDNYKLKELVSNKLHVLTPYIGIGLRNELFNNLYIHLKGFFGINLINQTKNKIKQSNSYFLPNQLIFPELSYQFTIGLEYAFKRTKEKHLTNAKTQ